MTNSPTFLPYGRQAIDDEDIAAVAATLRGEYLTTGPMVAAFESEFAKATGQKRPWPATAGRPRCIWQHWRSTSSPARRLLCQH